MKKKNNALIGRFFFTDLHNVRESEHMNLYVGLVMIYLYTSCATWIVCEAHAIFKALTSGIISGRAKIYVPFGYGTPITIIGVLFLLFANELGNFYSFFYNYLYIKSIWSLIFLYFFNKVPIPVVLLPGMT